MIDDKRIYSGYVDSIVFRNEENGYTVFTLDENGKSRTCVGIFQMISEGEFYDIVGDEINHPMYGPQIKVNSYTMKIPDDEKSMERYLGSGAIKGIGAAMAARIVRRFHGDTFRIMEEEPERLAEIKGISLKKAMEISAQMEEKQDLRRAMLFLQDFGITNTLAVKIYQFYGEKLYEVMRTNPYRLADDIPGVGFKIADGIAIHAGIPEDSEYRIKCGVLYSLSQAGASGHMYLPKDVLIRYASQFLGVVVEDWDQIFMDLLIEKKLVQKNEGEEVQIYPAQNYYVELNSARMLQDLNVRTQIDRSRVRKKLDQMEKRTGIVLDEHQREAVEESVCNGVFIMTGGPGTGKTTTIRTMLQYFEGEGMEIALAAPTGRAAKRMTETTGWEAQTIHRLLEVSGNPDQRLNGTLFEKNEQNPLEYDVIIVDEMSMVDSFLLHSLLKAIVPGTRLILVGDVDQLPSVGPGNVLKDLIRSGSFAVVKLTKIFRQDDESDIIVNAHKINEGLSVDLTKRSKDFLYIKREDPQIAVSAMVTLIQKKLPGYVDADPLDIQILTPTRKGMLGVENLNLVLQQYLNPPAENKREKEVNGVIFREGDKVMQIKNDYQLSWEIRGRHRLLIDQGLGVFNGDTGIIRTINPSTEMMEVEFEDHRFVVYNFSQLDELELAFAITIHKSQGSEYPAVVIPLFPGPKMLMNRNLLYTAVTRAKKCVCLVGLEDIFFEMAANEKEQMRYSGLALRCRELEGGLFV